MIEEQLTQEENRKTLESIGKVESLEKGDLRFMPIGTEKNMFEHIQQLSANQIKLLMAFQGMSMQDVAERIHSDADKQTRYVDMTDKHMNDIYKSLRMTKPTGISCMKKLKEFGWIEERTVNDRKYLIIKNAVGCKDFWTKCSINTDLYRIIKGSCNRSTIKVYLYHCFQGGMNKEKDYYYKVSLKQIAESIGVSKTNLQQIIDSNDLLWELGVIEIDKRWKKVDDGTFHETITYKFNHLYRTKRQIAELKRKGTKYTPKDITSFNPFPDEYCI